MDLSRKPWAALRLLSEGAVSKKRKPIWYVALILSLALISGLFATAKAVTVEADGKRIQYITFRHTVGDFLQHTKLNVYPEDLVLPGRETPIRRGMEISLKRSVPVVINIDGRQMNFRTLSMDVGQALESAGRKFDFRLKDSDEVLPGRDSAIKPYLSIKVTRSIPITITADGSTQKLEMAPRTIKEVLAKQKINLGPKDLVTPNLDQVITANTNIKVSRVAEQVISVQSGLPYQVVTKPGDFPVGFPDRVVSQGTMGLQEQVFKVTYQDGVESGREVLSQQVLRKPVDQIVARGAQTTISRGGSTIQFKRAMTVRATAYCIPGGTTSVGMPVGRGVVAVDPGVIPYYTDLWIDGYGTGKALDTGGAIKGNAIDLYFDNQQDAVNWGVRYVTVYLK